MAAGDKVTVACKLPNGIEIRGMRKETADELVLGGGTRSVVRFVHDGRSVVIAGVARDIMEPPGAPIENGYALTFGVDADLWNEWAEANKALPAVERGLIFAVKKAADTASATRSGESIVSGFEPIDPASSAIGVKAA
jgi:hypothetical protein